MLRRLLPVACCLTVLAACGPARERGGEGDPDPVVTAECGDGKVDPGESCDTKIGQPDGEGSGGDPNAPGRCPTGGGDCDDFNPCTIDGITGTGCATKCVHSTVSTCLTGDGCCPAACNVENDSECVPQCGNGKVDEGEKCDGNCPSSCDDRDACTIDQLVGSRESCSAACLHAPIDGCNVNPCGNGKIDSGEACDKGIAAGKAGACPTECAASAACTTATLQGTAADCSAKCVAGTITACTASDQCCPSTCTFATDNDCPPPEEKCGNGRIDSGEICDKGITSGTGACPTACDDGKTCTKDTLTGTAAACTAKCTFGNITACGASDQCCPAGCTDANDGDCDPASTVNPNIGKACTNASQCGSGGACIPAPDMPGGYCTVECTSNSQCGDGAFCDTAGGVCFKSCTATSQCGRSGYECFDRGDGRACYPVASGSGAVGAACTGITACAGGQNGTCASLPGGYCTLLCANTNCPSGSHCAEGWGGCVKNCTSASSCRNGYGCVDFDSDGLNECYPAATGSGAVGDACTSASQCAGGTRGDCITDANGWPGGYCVLDCSTGTCPSGSACTSFEGGLQYCLKTCTSTCPRSGYSCQSGGTANVCAP